MELINLILNISLEQYTPDMSNTRQYSNNSKNINIFQDKNTIISKISPIHLINCNEDLFIFDKLTPYNKYI